MKYKTLAKAILVGAVLVPAVSNANPHFNRSIESVDDLLGFQQSIARADVKQREELLGREMKLKGMREYARSVAIRAGINAGIESINQQIQDYSRQLDAIYNFEGLMVHKRVVPPVVTESSNLFNQTGNNQIRTSGKIYNIHSQARFSSVAPNWREYLNFPTESSAYEKYSYASTNLYPENKMEREIWVEATREGWKEGVNQAGVLLEQAFDRLNRDYVGMTRYHILALEGRVSMPVVSNYKLYDSNTGSRMVMDENLIKLEVLPTFKSGKQKGLGEEWEVPKSFQSLQDDLNRPVALVDENQQKELQRDIQKQIQQEANDNVPKPSSDYIVVPDTPHTDTGSVLVTQEDAYNHTPVRISQKAKSDINNNLEPVTITPAETPAQAVITESAQPQVPQVQPQAVETNVEVSRDDVKNYEPVVITEESGGLRMTRTITVIGSAPSVETHQATPEQNVQITSGDVVEGAIQHTEGGNK